MLVVIGTSKATSMVVDSRTESGGMLLGYGRLILCS